MGDTARRALAVRGVCLNAVPQFRLDLLSIFHRMLTSMALAAEAEMMHLRARVCWLPCARRLDTGPCGAPLTMTAPVPRLCAPPAVMARQGAYFGKSRLVWQADLPTTQAELNMCGVMDLVMDLVSTPDDGKSSWLFGPRARRTQFADNFFFRGRRGLHGAGAR